MTTCGGIVGHAFSPCTLPAGHGDPCEWQKAYATHLPDGHKLTLIVHSRGDVQLAVTFPDGSRTYGSLPDSDGRSDCGHTCCDERTDPFHDHFLSADDCPRCKKASH